MSLRYLYLLPVLMVGAACIGCEDHDWHHDHDRVIVREPEHHEPEHVIVHEEPDHHDHY
ncbi:MAG TPA: hypothetical protein VFE58_07495 [Tepidisphaeraceae bacterium]|nr:hypothetical protein [Tepidisphaeraceae bacterium]